MKAFRQGSPSRNVTDSSPHINCLFNALQLKGKSRENGFVVDAFQLALAIILLGVVIWVGDAIAGGIDGAHGEKKMRDRDA